MMNPERIRKRRSYQRWEYLAELLQDKPTIPMILRHVHHIIDGVRGYGSETASAWSEESLDLLVKDKNL